MQLVGFQVSVHGVSLRYLTSLLYEFYCRQKLYS